MLLGNDIVDLREAAGEHPRFSERVLHTSEISLLSKGPASLLWQYWAAKEAAYKALSQREAVAFHPTEWRVDFENGRVFFREHCLYLSLHYDTEHVRAVCCSEANGKIHEAVRQNPKEAPPQQQSVEARRLLQELCGSVLGELPHCEGIPHFPGIEQRAVSISHHGRWIYAALALPG